MNTYVFYRSGISGGTATLAMRICKYLIKEGHNACYIYKVNNSEDNCKSFRNVGIELINVSDFSVDRFKIAGRVVVVAYTLEEYWEATKLFKKVDNKVVFLYPVSNYVTGVKFHNYKLLYSIDRFLAKGYFEYLYRNNLILFTTQGMENKHISFYKIKSTNRNLSVGLPIEIGDINESQIRKKINEKNKIILTVLRADFPLRGYVFGLIDDMKIIHEKYPFVSLRVISFGEELYKIYDKILNEQAESYVEVVEGCSYDKLGEYINEAYLNIGHGTSVIDATSRGVPTAVAVQFEYSSDCVGLFSEAKTITGLPKNVNGNFAKYIEKTLTLSEDDYVSLCKAEYDYTERCFSMRTFVQKLHAEEEMLFQQNINFGVKRLMPFKIAFEKIVSLGKKKGRKNDKF